jgi:hypothetical protein
MCKIRLPVRAVKKGIVDVIGGQNLKPPHAHDRFKLMWVKCGDGGVDLGDGRD